MFDNSYFKYIKEQNDNELLVLETDDVLFKDEGFRCGQPVFLYSHAVSVFLTCEGESMRS